MTEQKYTTPEQIEDMRREIRLQKQLLSGGAGDKKKLRAKKRIRRIVSWTVYVLVLAVLAHAVIIIQQAKNKGEVPEIFGFYLFSIESGSMEPTLGVGTIILSRQTAHPGALSEGDIVTFRTLSGDIVTHRIMEVETDGGGNVSYRTKGDNPVNSPDEELLTPDRVIAVFVAKIPLT